MSKALKENYIIRIKSRIEQDGETEQIELMTRGSFTLREGSYHITYRETETTGYEGNVTTLKIAADDLGQLLARKGLRAGREHGATHFFVSDVPDSFIQTADLFLGEYRGGTAEQICIDKY